jgi:hypothetical protein
LDDFGSSVEREANGQVLWRALAEVDKYGIRGEPLARKQGGVAGSAWGSLRAVLA